MVFKKVPYTSLSIGAFIDSLKKEEIFVIQRLKYNEYTASSDMTLLLKEMLIP